MGNDKTEKRLGGSGIGCWEGGRGGWGNEKGLCEKKIIKKEGTVGEKN